MDSREVVREALRGLDEAGGQGFIDRLADDAEMVSPLAALQGREAIGEFVRGMHASFTDWKHDVRIESAGDLVVVEGTWSGTNTGSMQTPQGEIPATNRRATLPFAGIARVEGDRIVSVHNYFDQMAMTAQLGLMPEPATA
jgi:limonene-1,2-epoxide hydrolase